MMLLGTVGNEGPRSSFLWSFSGTNDVGTIALISPSAPRTDGRRSAAEHRSVAGGQRDLAPSAVCLKGGGMRGAARDVGSFFCNLLTPFAS